MRKLFLCWVIVLLSTLRVFAAPTAEEVQHLRAVIRNIQWPMLYVTDALLAGESCNAFEFIGTDGAYTALGTSDRYFSNIIVPAGQDWATDVCEIRFTINTTINAQSGGYKLPIPDMVQGGKILLTKLPSHHLYKPTWSCKTNIDAGLDNVFQGASTMLIESAPSIISHFTDNLYLGNCLYTSTPWEVE